MREAVEKEMKGPGRLLLNTQEGSSSTQTQGPKKSGPYHYDKCNPEGLEEGGGVGCQNVPRELGLSSQI